MYKFLYPGNYYEFIAQLNKLKQINVQRTCFNCKHYLFVNKDFSGGLSNQKHLKENS